MTEDFDISSKIEKSIEDCNEHYQGMLDVYYAVIQELRVGKKLSAVGKKPVSQTKSKTPYEVGVTDGQKKISKILENELSAEEALEILKHEISRIEKIIS